ncbi:hypothetical protein [Derxia gummosa]|uniref:Uncharacterized protein n=1 Tax=Derxia gummosa DSM 723 TaxID=1121388 RepID=A0A8B6XCI0_9BURK|nr:hypothetical protein [Derxia gummosa]
MNRFSQFIADTCVSTLANLASKTEAMNLKTLNANSSLKYNLIMDPYITVEITDRTSFSVFEQKQGIVIPNGPALSEARIADFLLGAQRVKKQYEAVSSMRSGRFPSAWVIVSAYYCAYFACIELCKLNDRISISFEEDELASLKQKALGPGHADFFQDPQQNFVGSSYAGKLRFKAIGTKPHAIAWENAHITIRKIFEKKEWLDATYYTKLLSDPEQSPSRIRNIWNYRRSDYFGATGEDHAREFRSIIGNHDGAYAWTRRKAGSTYPMDPCVIAAFCEALSLAILDAYDRAISILTARD